MVSHNKATLHELDTVYGSKDLYELLDIIMVDAYNNHLIKQANSRNE